MLISSSSALSTVFCLVAIFCAHLLFSQTTTTDAFATVRPPATAHQRAAVLARRRRSTGRTQSAVVALFMGKGLNKAKNKQLLLKQKLEDAKRKKLIDQSNENDDDNGDASKTRQKLQQLTDKEIQEKNDRLRFEELLKKGSASVLNDYSEDGYLNKQQEEEEIDAFRKYSSASRFCLPCFVVVSCRSFSNFGVRIRWTRLAHPFDVTYTILSGAGVDRIFEGDPAPEECFEELVSIKSENAIGVTGKQRLVPWLRKNAARHDDYTVIISDPRPQSPELRETVRNMMNELPLDVRSRTVIVNADSPSENRRWLKKAGLPDDKVDVYSDEKMEWMRAYTALGENRWSMTMFIIQKGKVAKLAREIDQYGACRAVRNACKALSDEARLS